MREIPKKNYVVLILLTVLTLIAVYYLRNLYLDKVKYEVESNSAMNFLSEIKKDELSNYLMENREIIIYMSKAKEELNSTFKDDLKNYIVNNNLGKNIVYINLDNVNDNFYSEFKQKFFGIDIKTSDIELSHVSNLLYVSDSKVIEILNSDITYDKAKSFIESHIEEE